jgi:hypothetical protein
MKLNRTRTVTYGAGFSFFGPDKLVSAGSATADLPTYVESRRTLANSPGCVIMALWPAASNSCTRNPRACARSAASENQGASVHWMKFRGIDSPAYSAS